MKNMALIEKNTPPDNIESETLYLTFWIDQQLFGMPIVDVVQIVRIQPIVEIPDSPDYVKGIIDLRGLIVPVIDARLRFKKKQTPCNEQTCIIIVAINNSTVGLVVDGVDEVLSLNESSISTPSNITFCESCDSLITGISNVNQKIVLLINTGKVISDRNFTL